MQNLFISCTPFCWLSGLFPVLLGGLFQKFFVYTQISKYLPISSSSSFRGKDFKAFHVFSIDIFKVEDINVLSFFYMWFSKHWGCLFSYACILFILWIYVRVLNFHHSPSSSPPSNSYCPSPTTPSQIHDLFSLLLLHICAYINI